MIDRGHPPKKRSSLLSISLLLIIAILLNGCGEIEIPFLDGKKPIDLPLNESVGLAQEVVLAKVTFKVSSSTPLAENQKMMLEVLDEVTGLALNAQRLQMHSSAENRYSLTIPLPVGSVIKYRYVRESDPRMIEYASNQMQVRYRMVLVRGPQVVEDLISAWGDAPYTGVYGRIDGKINETGTDKPVIGALVSAGGQQTLSASDGSFILDGLPPGKHNVVVYSLDGSYPPYQQEAEISPESSTKAQIWVKPALYVNVTFEVTAPGDIPEGAPIRIVGNIYPLGNTFADLRGGVSTIASRAPQLSYQRNRQYRITVRLPAGLDLRYKFTLGDGFWNAERAEDAILAPRQLIIPERDTTIKIRLASFKTPGFGEVTFKVTIPDEIKLAADEVLSIQFNPYGWTEPIPMWKVADNQWAYILYTPLDKGLVGDIGYRFCKNDQCGIADDASTIGQDIAGKLFHANETPQSIAYTVEKWAWTNAEPAAITIASVEVAQKPPAFIKGVELLPDYHPSWQAYIGPAFDQLNTIHANMVILSPTWHLTSTNPPVAASVPGQDSSWYDLRRMATLAREKGLAVAIHPSLAYYQPHQVWWSNAVRDANWWQTWFDRYETFVLNHADFATLVSAQYLVLGDASLNPAFSGSTLADGSPSNVPGYADERWNQLIARVRERFQGQVIWKVDYPGDKDRLPNVLSQVDLIYVVMTGRLGAYEVPTKDAIRDSAKVVLDNDLAQIRDRFGKPILLGVSYPSADGAAISCVHSGADCMPWYVFEQAGLELPAVTLDLDEQTDIFNGIAEAVNQTDWISGLVAGGFYPAISVQDKSISIRGKPAMDIIWFWFSRYHSPAP